MWLWPPFVVTVIVSSGASPESSWWSEDKVGIGREKTLPEWLRVATEERGGDLMSLNRSVATLPLTRIYFFCSDRLKLRDESQSVCMRYVGAHLLLSLVPLTTGSMFSNLNSNPVQSPAPCADFILRCSYCGLRSPIFPANSRIQQ